MLECHDKSDAPQQEGCGFQGRRHNIHKVETLEDHETFEKDKDKDDNSVKGPGPAGNV